MLEFMTRLNLIACVSQFRLEANLQVIAGNRPAPILIDRKVITRKQSVVIM